MLLRLLAFSTGVLLLSACGDSEKIVENPDTGELVVRASGSAVAPVLTSNDYASAVSAASFEVGFAEMRVTANADCSGPYQTVFSRGTATRVDLITNPEIGRADGLKRGSYPCVVMRMSDILRYRPVVTEGPCVAGVFTQKDIYRVGSDAAAWRDPEGAAIVARGTDLAPVEDLVWIFITTNELAAEARGYGVNQTISLGSPLVVPGTTTFFWDLSNALGDEGDGRCGTVGGTIGFR